MAHLGDSEERALQNPAHLDRDLILVLSKLAV